MLFAHGAGADMNSDFMQEVSIRLRERGVILKRFNFPYMVKRSQDGKRRPPDRFPALQQSMIEHCQTMDAQQLPMFVAGKSMGGRVAVTVADQVNAKAAIVFGYPFHPIGKPEKLRLEPFFESQSPVMVLQGTRDTMGDKSLVENLSLPERLQIRWFEDGDHSLKPRKRSGYDYADYLDTAAELCVCFMRAQLRT